MQAIMVWMLVSVNIHGGLEQIYFRTQQMCEHVQHNLPSSNQNKTKCIQAEILVTK